MTTSSLGSLFPWLLCVCSLAAADDWPQILGPHRNGRVEGEDLAESWPEGGPPILWQHKVGEGFAGAAVADNMVIVFHRVGEKERIEALAADNGKPLWKADFPASYAGRINPDSGPRTVPLINTKTNSIFALGAAGDLYCVSIEDGKTKWTRSTFDDFGGDEGYFGAGSTPLLIGDRLLVNVGGRDGAGIVAFSPSTGKTLWKATAEAASYSSPTSCNLGGKEVAVFVTRMNTVAIDPADGAEVFRFPFGKRGPTVNAATPLVEDGKLFVTASYGIGAKLLDLSEQEPKTLWENDESLSSQYNTPVIHEGKLYGIHGREDIGVAELRCVDLLTGKVNWRQPDFGVAHAILSGETLLLLKNDGSLVMAKANARDFMPVATAELFEGTVRAIPALARGRLYARDDTTLKCVQLGK